MTPLPAARVLDQFFLDARARVLDVAATLDRLDRGADAATAAVDPRVVRLRRAVEVLLDGDPDRAARVQQIFSLDYDPAWERPRPRL